MNIGFNRVVFAIVFPVEQGNMGNPQHIAVGDTHGSAVNSIVGNPTPGKPEDFISGHSFRPSLHGGIVQIMIEEGH